MKTTRVVVCQCSRTDLLAPQARAELLASARRVAGTQVDVVDDLCALCERRDARLTQWAADKDLIVVACYGRAVRALFEFAAAPLDAAATVLNARIIGAAQIEESLKDLLAAQGAAMAREPATDPAPAPSDSAPAGWAPWYPVIDSARCVQCKKCLGFCLFGVYAMDGVKVRVAHPRNCKNNCPACARVCPQAAIIFPKCKDSPINGDDVQPGAAGGTSVNIDLDAIVGASDLYAALRQRGAGLPDAPPPERPEPASAGGAGRQSKEPR